MSRQQKIHLRPLLLALLAGTALSCPAEAAEPSGKAVKVSTNATAAGSGGTRILSAPDDIFQGDQITTDKAGEAQIVFVDNTRFAIGPNSKVTIDEFVFKPNGTAVDVGLAAVKGSFRFIGGHSPSTVYSIRTPTAAIGIRGTALDVEVKLDGTTTVVWQQGSGWVCVIPVGEQSRQPSDCKDVSVGDITVAPPGGGFGQVDPADRVEIIKSMYYSYQQGTLDPQFQLGDEQDSSHEADQETPPHSPYQ